MAAGNESLESSLRANITQNLKLVVKKLQLTAASAFSDAALKSSDTTSALCYLLEAVFLLGLKSPYSTRQSVDPSTNSKVLSPSFWPFLGKFTHKDVSNQLSALKFITTETGLCRAWIRAALNDGLLTSYMSTVFELDVKIKRKFYNKDAYWFDLEQTSLISGLLQGIENLKFDLAYNVSLLNSWGVTPLELSGYIKVSPLPVLCSADSLTRSGDVATTTASPSQVSSTQRKLSQFENSYLDSRYSTEALGDLDIATPRRKTKRKKDRRRTTVLQAADANSWNASSESLTASETFRLETETSVEADGTDGGHSEASYHRPTSAASSSTNTSDARPSSVMPEDLEEQKVTDDLNAEVQIETLALDNPTVASPDNSQEILQEEVKTPSNGISEVATTLSHVADSESRNYGSSNLFETLETQAEAMKTSTPNISVLESSPPTGSGNKLSSHHLHSDLNTWTDTARSSPNLCSFLAPVPLSVPEDDDGGSLHNRQDPTSANTSRTDISTYSNERQSPRLQQAGVDHSLLFVNDTSQLSSATSSTSQDFEVIDQLVTPALLSTVPSASCPSPSSSAAFSSIYTRITHEKGLPTQNYMCKSCTSPIGTIYGKFQVCAYDSCYYCSRCHCNDEAVIPALIVHNWDFTPQKVSCAAKTFLCEMENEPLIDFEEMNNNLYEYIAPLREMYERRKRLKYAANYLLACSETASNQVRSRLWPKDYMLNNLHLYSVHDLLQLQTGYLAMHLQKVLDFCIKHIFDCLVCREKGFICEVCHSNEIIYAFNVDHTVSCETCCTVFHKTCKSDYAPCPTCRRRSAYSLNRSLTDS